MFAPCLTSPVINLLMSLHVLYRPPFDLRSLCMYICAFHCATLFVNVHVNGKVGGGWRSPQFPHLRAG